MIYFVRHGESEANAAGVIAGASESPLTAKGIGQAKQAAEAVREAGRHFDMIITSPLSRAYDTAMIIAEVLGYPREAIIVIDELHEKGAGTFEGGPLDALYAASPEEARAAGAESYDDFAARVKRATAQVLNDAQGETLVVAHAGVHRMAQCLAQGHLPSAMPDMDRVPNGQILTYPLM